MRRCCEDVEGPWRACIPWPQIDDRIPHKERDAQRRLRWRRRTAVLASAVFGDDDSLGRSLFPPAPVHPESRPLAIRGVIVVATLWRRSLALDE